MRRILILALAYVLAGCASSDSIQTTPSSPVIIDSAKFGSIEDGAAARNQGDISEESTETTWLNMGWTTPRPRTFEAGVAAWNQGDYETAQRLFRPMALKGNALAAYYMGIMYAEGHKVDRDPAKAAEWFLVAANKGYAPAQIRMAEISTVGLGVPRDPGQAVKWYTLAADAIPAHESQMRDDALARRDDLIRGLTPDQLRETQRQIWDWNPK